MWKRGTEFPCPSARPSPRSAQPTTGKTRCPIDRSHDRFSPAAKSTYASAQRRGQWSSSRSNCALPIQSCSASSWLSLDAHPALLGGVDQEQAAEAPERLATERLLGLLVDQHDPAPGVGGLGGGGQTGEPVAHDDHIGVHVGDPSDAGRGTRVGVVSDATNERPLEDGIERDFSAPDVLRRLPGARPAAVGAAAR